jgi:hypothetical protein
MKRLICILAIILTFSSIHGQVVPSSVYLIENDNKPFGIVLNKGTLISDLSNGSLWMLTEPAGGSLSLATTPGKVRVGGDSPPVATSRVNLSEDAAPQRNGYTENMANVKDYGADGTCASDATSSFERAFEAAGVIFIPAGCYKISRTLAIPAHKKMYFEKGAQLDITGEMVGKWTQIEAGLYHIFTVNSNISGTWDLIESYPEWFGARGDDKTQSGPALNKVLATFPRNVKMNGYRYLISETINLPKDCQLTMSPVTRIHIGANVDLFHAKYEKWSVTGAYIEIMDPTYNKWIFNIEASRRKYPVGEGGETERYNSYIANTTVVGYPRAGNDDYRGTAVKGIKVWSRELMDRNYFAMVNNFYIRRADTCVYLQGYPGGGMINSWHFNNCTFDQAMNHIVLSERAAGNTFTNLQIQPAKKMRTCIETYGDANRFTGFYWDIHMGMYEYRHPRGYIVNDSAIIIRKGAKNTVLEFNWTDLYKYITDENSVNTLNSVSENTLWGSTVNFYGDIVNTNSTGKVRIGAGRVNNAQRGIERLSVGGNLELYTIDETWTEVNASVTGTGNVPARSDMKYFVRFKDDMGNYSGWTKPATVNISTPSRVTLSIPEHEDPRAKVKQIYRYKATGDDKYYVGEIRNGQSEFIDNKSDDQLGDVIDESTFYDETAARIVKDQEVHLQLEDHRTVIKKNLFVDGRISAAEETVAPPPPYYALSGTSGSKITSKSGGVSEYPFSIYAEGIYQKSSDLFGLIGTLSSTGTTSFLGVGFDSRGEVLVTRRNPRQHNTKSGIRLSEGQPYVIAAIFQSPTEVSFFVNGEIVNKKDLPAVPLGDNFTEFITGAGRYTATNYHLKGWLSVVRLFKAALSQVDIEDMKEKENFIPIHLLEPITVNFTTGTKTPMKWFDNSANGNHGQVQGDITYKYAQVAMYIEGELMVDKGTLQLIPLDAPPTDNPEEGMMWFDGDSKDLMIYLKGAWHPIVVKGGRNY